VPPDTPVQIGYNRAFAPFASDMAGEANGLAIDVTRAALKAAGLEADFVALDLPRMFDQLLDGAVHMLTGTGAAASRADQIAFSRPVVATGGAWFPRADVDWPSDDGLKASAGEGLRVVTPAAGPLAGHIRQAFPQLTLLTCDDYAGALAQVAGGDADAAALNYHVAGRMIAGDGRFTAPVGVFIEIDLAMGVRAGDPDGLLARIDPHIPPVRSTED
jgi:ABC-type amino acid transport substrate-binding protein